MNCLKFLLMLSLAVMVSCGGNSNSTTATSEDKVEVEAAPDTEVPSFTTPDLILCDVKGHVKEITENNGEILTAKFDEEGTLMNYGNRDRISHIERDDNGRLVAFLGSEWMKVDWEGDLPSTIKSSYNEMTCTDKFVRDNEGKIVKITCIIEDLMEDSVNMEDRTVEYGADSFDSQGNWVKRTITYPSGEKYIQERTITYFE